MMRILMFLFLTMSTLCYGRGIYEYHRPVWAMGMGGVYTPFPRETDMPTANAAYLRHVHSMTLELFNLRMGAPGLTALQDLQDLPPMNSISDLNGYMGKTIWTGLDGRASLVAPNFGLSIYSDSYIRSYFTNPLMPEWYLDFISDYGFTVAAASSIGPDLSLGFAVKRINRWGGENVVGFDTIDEYIATQDSAVILDQFQDKGLGYGMDLSLLYKSDKSSMPILTLVWKDLGNTTFSKTSGSQAPPHIAQNLIFGAGYLLDGPGMDVKFGFEYRHINTINMQLGEKLHMGAELSLPLIDLRFGTSQGYATYGLGLDLWFFRLELAQYTIEQGQYPGQTPDQRIQLGLTLDLSVDADFNVTGQDGKRRKLKQRR